MGDNRDRPLPMGDDLGHPFFAGNVQKVLRTRQKIADPTSVSVEDRTALLAWPIAVYQVAVELALSAEVRRCAKHVDFLKVYEIDPLFALDLQRAITVHLHKKRKDRVSQKITRTDAMIENEGYKAKNNSPPILVRGAPPRPPEEWYLPDWSAVADEIERRYEQFKDRNSVLSEKLRRLHGTTAARWIKNLKKWSEHFAAWRKLGEETGDVRISGLFHLVITPECYRQQK